MQAVVDDARIRVEGLHRKAAGLEKCPQRYVRQGNRPGSVRDPEAGVHDLDDVRGPHRNPRVRRVEARGRSRGERQPGNPGCAAGGFAVIVAWTVGGALRPGGPESANRVLTESAAGHGARGIRWGLRSTRAARSRTFTVGRRPTSGDGVSPPAEADRRVTVPSGSRTVRRRATARSGRDQERDQERNRNTCANDRGGRNDDCPHRLPRRA